MDRYPDIADHGLIGDLQTAALVTKDGTLDWFCLPRFDSPSVFASLLDAEHGGFYRIAPDRADYVSRQLYLPDTAILVTRFMTPDGVGEVHDFMPIAGAFGPFFYGALIGNGTSRTPLFWGYLIGAGIMIIGGLVEVFLGVQAAGKSLEQVTKPITAVDDQTATPTGPTAAPTAA